MSRASLPYPFAVSNCYVVVCNVELVGSGLRVVHKLSSQSNATRIHNCNSASGTDE